MSRGPHVVPPLSAPRFKPHAPYLSREVVSTYAFCVPNRDASSAIADAELRHLLASQAVAWTFEHAPQHLAAAVARWRETLNAITGAVNPPPPTDAEWRCEHGTPGDEPCWSCEREERRAQGRCPDCGGRADGETIFCGTCLVERDRDRLSDDESAEVPF